jgi:hypothetical protein
MYTTFIYRKQYGNPVGVYFDDMSEYPLNYAPRIKFQHNYKYMSDMSNLVEMSIEDDPKILTNNLHEILPNDITLLKEWVIYYKDILLNWKGINDDSYILEYFRHKPLIPEFEKEINEDKTDESLDMGVMASSEPKFYNHKGNRGLPNNLEVYIDDSLEYEYRTENNLKYTPKIKFVGDYYNPNDSTDRIFDVYIPMSIEEEPKILYDMDHNISDTDIKDLKSWVKLHKEMLLKTTKGEIDHIDFFEYLNEYYKNENI